MLTEASRTPALRTPNIAGSKAGNFFAPPSHRLIRVPITAGAGASKFLYLILLYSLSTLGAGGTVPKILTVSAAPARRIASRTLSGRNAPTS